jgi:hypothetical protein
MNVRDFTTQQLIDELADRGLTVFTADEIEEVNNDIAGGEVLAGLIGALSSAIFIEDGNLQIKLIDAMIYAATGEEVSVELPPFEVNVNTHNHQFA